MCCAAGLSHKTQVVQACKHCFSGHLEQCDCCTVEESSIQKPGPHHPAQIGGPRRHVTPADVLLRPRIHPTPDRRHMRPWDRLWLTCTRLCVMCKSRCFFTETPGAAQKAEVTAHYKAVSFRLLRTNVLRIATRGLLRPNLMSKDLLLPHLRLLAVEHGSPVVPEENRMLVTSYASAMWGSKPASAGTLVMRSCQAKSPSLN